MAKLTVKDLKAIRERLERTTGGDWYPMDGVYVGDISDVTTDSDGTMTDARDVAECENEGDAEFLGNAKYDIERLLEDVDRLRSIVHEIGYSAILFNNENDVMYDEVREQRWAAEQAAAKEFANHMTDVGIEFCKSCGNLFRLIDSISPEECASCVNDDDMRAHGWTYEGWEDDVE